jgi:hypothetical protein
MIPTTSERVLQNTADSINEQIRRQTESNVTRYASAGTAAIDRRLAELDNEWDIERYLETMAPTFTLMGMALGLTVNRKWFVLPFLVQSFFLQHALQGWCPPLPILRRLGVRTMSEIEEERYALKAMRGDFQGMSNAPGRTSDVMQAVRR